jgi:quinol monooxygenase YgiN
MSAPRPYVRVAYIEIDPAQLEAFRAAIAEEIDISVRAEPGVLALHAVSDQNNPADVVVFEIYASPATYQAHLRTPHFLNYKSATQGMIKSLKQREMSPIALGAKRA